MMKIWTSYFSLILTIIDAKSVDVSFHQPILCSGTIWNPNGSTFATSADTNLYPNSIFIDKSDTIYVAANERHSVVKWTWENGSFIKSIDTTNLFFPYGLFVSTSGSVYVDNAVQNQRVDRWFSNGTRDSPMMNLSSRCYGLFLDHNDTLYCSLVAEDVILKKSLDSAPNLSATFAAGNRTKGSTAELLDGPHGIFVDSDLNLYVADSNNHRIQRFNSASTAGMTLLDNVTSTNIRLNYPTAVTMDANGFLYICDSQNHRIVGQGPNGFQCIVGCTSSNGSAAYQLNAPSSFSFDSHGNIYVSDRYNHRIQKFLLAKNSCISYNQPKLSPTACWEPNGISFTNNQSSFRVVWGIFIDTNDSIYVMGRSIDNIVVWQNNNSTIAKNIPIPGTDQTSIFTDSNGDIYFDSGANGTTWIYKWSSQTNISEMMVLVNGRCHGLFVDPFDAIYCSMGDYHRVLRGYANVTTKIAGNGTPGDASDLLSSPLGIFVTLKRDLYVADCRNNRIQLFKYGQFNATTVLGNSTFPLNCPSSLIFDYDGNLFITDSFNSRIMSFGLYGYRCIVGCSQANGSAAHQLFDPQSLRFDSHGNLFVCDSGNHRVQLFLVNTSCSATQIFLPRPCSNSSVIGSQCNIKASPCDVLKPCFNQGTCLNVNNNTLNYVCLCQMGFTGKQCEINQQPCQADTCRHGGICNQTSNTTFDCLCSLEWQGIRCEQKKNYCQNISCLNDGICRSLSANYRCECLGDYYSGRHCEIISNSIKIHQIVARSFAFVAIIVISATVLFIVIMDVLKYGFNVDPICREMKTKKKRQKRKMIVAHFIYHH